MRSIDFLALVTPSDDLVAHAAIAHVAATAGLTERVLVGPLAFYGAPGNPPLLLPEAGGLVWGTLFAPDSARVQAIDIQTHESWTQSRGATLVDRYWGSYLALLVEARTATVVRDPSGFIPCYRYDRGGAVLLASNARLLADTGWMSGAIDWGEVASQLQYYSLRTARTALLDVSEIVPGSACTIGSQGSAARTLWSPARYAQGWDRRASLGDGAKVVRRAVLAAVDAQSRQFARPLVQLSGGLDSSVVTAALAAAGSQAICVTFRGGAADLDERGYARAMAAKAGFPLIERQLDLSLIDLTRSVAKDLPRPTGRSFSQADDLQARALAAELGCDAFFTGGGGDNVFWYQNTVSPALDRLRCAGPAGALATLWDLAEMCGVTRGTALGISMRKLVQPRPRPWPHDLTFLAPELGQLVKENDHPWLPEDASMLPGVRAYVRGLIQMQDHFEYYGRAEHAPILAPPLAQPVVEACLGVPSWLWCEGGHNRAVARAAFADLLPPEIAYRRTKGGFNSFNHQLLERQRGLVREMLLGGHLGRNALINTSAIEAVLEGERPVSDSIAGRLLRLVSIEAWLQCWGAGGARSARQRRY